MDPFFDSLNMLDNTPKELFRLGDTPIMARALRIGEGSVWCKEARHAIGVLRRAEELRATATAAQKTARESGDFEATDRVLAKFVEAENLEARYFELVEDLVLQYLKLTIVAAPFFDELTPAQCTRIFEVAFMLSDPTHAAKLSQMNTLKATMAMAAAAAKMMAKTEDSASDGAGAPPA